MKKDLTQPLKAITFACSACADGRTFRAEPSRVEDDAEQAHHPFRYFAACPVCGTQCEQQANERALIKAWASATGPRTPEGKARSAKNLEGHPTPEEAQRTRFNAMKHGLNARVATFFPAKPDGYAFCKTCEVDRVWCAQQAACVKQSQNFMLHHAAFATRNPKLLDDIYADFQAALFTVLQQILQTIIADGVELITPEWYTTKDGEMLVAEYTDAKTGELRRINNVEAHPLFKPLAELMSRTGITLTDMGMTTRAIDGVEDEEMGRLSDAEPEDVAAFNRRQSDALAALKGVIERGKAQRDRDPVLIEYRKNE